MAILAIGIPEGMRMAGTGVGDGWVYYASDDVAYSFTNAECLFGCPADQSPFVDAVTRAVASLADGQ